MSKLREEKRKKENNTNWGSKKRERKITAGEKIEEAKLHWEDSTKNCSLLDIWVFTRIVKSKRLNAGKCKKTLNAEKC